MASKKIKSTGSPKVKKVVSTSTRRDSKKLHDMLDKHYEAQGYKGWEEIEIPNTKDWKPQEEKMSLPNKITIALSVVNVLILLILVIHNL